MLLRIVWFIGVCLAAAAGPLWVLLLIGMPYLLRYASVELVVLALLVDSYYGFERTEWPIYTIVTLCGIIAVRLLRPYISVYNR